MQKPSFFSKGEKSLDSGYSVKALKKILSLGADVNERYISPPGVYSRQAGTTPLHVAVRWAKSGPEAIEYLLSQGADKTAVNRDGYTPYQLYSLYISRLGCDDLEKCERIARLLVPEGEEGSVDILLETVKARNLEIVKPSSAHTEKLKAEWRRHDLSELISMFEGVQKSTRSGGEYDFLELAGISTSSFEKFCANSAQMHLKKESVQKKINKIQREADVKIGRIKREFAEIEKAFLEQAVENFNLVEYILSRTKKPDLESLGMLRSREDVKLAKEDIVHLQYLLQANERIKALLKEREEPVDEIPEEIFAARVDE